MRDKSNIDYITKDYEGFRQLMIDLIPQYAPEWTDTSQSDFGIVLIELLANALDIISYYQDKNYNEAFLPTAETRKSIVSLCKMLGYNLKSQKPAIHEVTFTKDLSYLSQNITIPKGTKVGTDPMLGSQVIYEIQDKDVVIKSGESTTTALVVQGETVKEDVLGISSGEGYQKFKITYPDVIPETLDIYVLENGVEKKWERVSDFMKSARGDNHYTIEFTEFNEAIVEFGNGLSGNIPKPYSNIIAYYRVGGGIIGNVGLGKINSFVDLEFPGVELSNTLLVSEGEDLESAERAKIVAPKFFRSTERAVTKFDFIDLALTLPYVKLANIIENQLENLVEIYMLPTKSETLTEMQIKDAEEFFKEKKMLGVNVGIKSPTMRPIDISVHIKALPNYYNKDIKELVDETIKDEFELGNYDFGEGLVISDLVGSINQLDGVRSVSVISPIKDIEDVAENEIMKLNTVTIEVVGGYDE